MSKQKKIWIAVAAVAIVVVLAAAAFLIQANSQNGIPEDAVVQPTTEPVATESPEPTPTARPALEINWQELWDINDEIYAWIDIPGTEMSFPILQRASNDAFYLRHDIYGDYSSSGSIYTEGAYNTTTFEDPVTLIYGHNMLDDSFFSHLQEYASQLELDENAIIDIYMPGVRKTYQIFAAVPHDNLHILYYNDFNDEAAYTNFFDKVYKIRDLQANTNPDMMPSFGDKVIILSTCLIGNDNGRYLVMGVLTEETPLTQS